MDGRMNPPSRQCFKKFLCDRQMIGWGSFLKFVPLIQSPDRITSCPIAG